MALTITPDRARVERISRNFTILTGSIAFDNNYQAGGMDLADMSKYFSTMKSVIFEGEAGYLFEYDKTNDTVIVYEPVAVPGIAAEAAHTHEVILDAGASAAGSSHTHNFGTLGEAASASGSSHDHALSGSTAAAGTGATGSGDSHDHVFTGEALTTHQHAAAGTGASGAGGSHTHGVGTLADAASGGPSAAIAATNAVYRVRRPAAMDYTDATEHDVEDWDLTSIVGSSAVAVHLRILVRDDTVGSYVQICRKNAAHYSEYFYAYVLVADKDTWYDFVIECDSDEIVWVKTSDLAAAGPITKCEIVVAGWFDAITIPSGTHTHAVLLDTGVSGAENAHTHTGPSHQHAAITAGTPAGDNAAEATHAHTGPSHTHAAGTLDAAAEAGHTHVIDLDTGVTGAETAHTHGPGTLEDEASAAGSSHTHVMTGGAGTEVTEGDDLSGITALQFIAIGLKD